MPAEYEESGPWSPEERAFAEAWELATETQRKEFADAIREDRHMLCSYRQARALIAHWLSPVYAENLPAYALGIAIRKLRTARHLEPLHAAELHLLREQERRREQERTKQLEYEMAARKIA